MESPQRVAETRLPTSHGVFRMLVYRDGEGLEHVALTVGDVTDGAPVLVRVHSECLTGDVFGSHRCDCGEQLDRSLDYLQQQGRGVLLYLRQEGRGIGLANKIRAYGLAAATLRDLGIARVRLLTNNPDKIAGLERNGIAVVERIPLQTLPHPA